MPSPLDELQARTRAAGDRAATRASDNRTRAPEFAEFVDALRLQAPELRVRWVRWADGSEQGVRSPKWQGWLPGPRPIDARWRR